MVVICADRQHSMKIMKIVQKMSHESYKYRHVNCKIKTHVIGGNNNIVKKPTHNSLAHQMNVYCAEFVCFFSFLPVFRIHVEKLLFLSTLSVTSFSLLHIHIHILKCTGHN